MRGPPPRHPDDQREQLPPVEGVVADAADLSVGDRVVYPNQGVCVVAGIEEKDISGQKLVMVRMQSVEDGATVSVPWSKVPTVGLRRVATTAQIEGVFHYLAAVFDDPELDWKIRHRDNADRLIAGGVLGVAEVVKGLHSLSRIRPLPTKEREQYDNARHLLVQEVAESLRVAPGLAEDYVDYALMPPTGTRFDLKPPPTPVMLPSRPRKRRPAVVEEGEGLDDLGLGDLGIDLGADLDGALAAVGGEVPAATEGGEGAAAGEGEAAGAEEGAEAPVPAETKARPVAGKKAAAKPAGKKPAKAAPKAAARKPARPAGKKPAPKPARASKAAGKKPGKGKKR